MAFIVLTTPWSAISPAFGLSDGALWARTNLGWQVVTLGWGARTVRIHHGFVEIADRSWWVRRSTEMVPLEHVSHIDYGYDEYVVGGNQFGDATDAVERFTVALVLKEAQGERRVPLFDFWGEGHVAPALGSGLIDERGTQEGDSLGFVELLRRHTGLPMGEPMEAIPDAEGRLWQCTACGRDSGPAAKRCLYCGGEVAPG